MMQHAQANYNLKLLLKADDDTYVNVPVMLNALRETVKDRFVYIGYPTRKTQQYAPNPLAGYACQSQYLLNTTLSTELICVPMCVTQRWLALLMTACTSVTLSLSDARLLAIMEKG